MSDYDEAVKRHEAWVADLRADRIRRTGQGDRELVYDQPQPKYRKKMVSMRPNIREATVVLRVPYEAQGYYTDDEIVETEVTIVDLFKAMVDCLEGSAFGREDSVSFRMSSYGLSFGLMGVPDSIERERRLEV